MQRKEFLQLLEELLELDDNTLTGGEKLLDLPNWSSLTLIGLIAMVDEEFSIILSPNAILESGTVDGFIALLGDQIDD